MPITGPDPGCLEADELGTGCDRPTVLVSAVALIDVDGRVLITKRPEGKAMAGLWEFPGGKVEAGESVETALVRELAEELGIRVEASEPFMTLDYDYADKQVRLDVHHVTRWQGEARGVEGQPLAWQLPSAMVNWPFPEANAPILARLLAR